MSSSWPMSADNAWIFGNLLIWKPFCQRLATLHNKFGCLGITPGPDSAIDSKYHMRESRCGPLISSTR